MDIPDYFITAMARRYRRIVENTRCDMQDTRTANALRLAKSDIARLERYADEIMRRKTAIKNQDGKQGL